jgi:hypothetical protein
LPFSPFSGLVFTGSQVALAPGGASSSANKPTFQTLDNHFFSIDEAGQGYPFSRYFSVIEE